MILSGATGFFTFVSILFFAVSVQCQASDTIYTIPKGTKIIVRMDNEINSKVSSVNDTFTVTTAAPVVNRGVEVLPAGLVIEGRITRVKRASAGRKPGNFELVFETLFLPEGGGKRQINAVLIKEKKDNSSRAANVLTVAGATGIGGLIGSFIEKSKGALIGAGVGLGVGAGIVLLQKGDEVRIKANDEFSIQLQKDLILPPQDY